MSFIPKESSNAYGKNLKVTKIGIKALRFSEAMLKKENDICNIKCIKFTMDKTTDSMTTQE